MTVWYPMPRRLASRLAQASAAGCNRNETGLYRSWDNFGGRPLGASLIPSFAIASRFSLSSFAVMRRAREKSKGSFSQSSSFFITDPFIRTCRPGADYPFRVFVSHCIDDYDDLCGRRADHFIDFSDQLEACLSLHHTRFNLCMRVVQSSGRIVKRNPMFKPICDRFIDVPFDVHINCIYRKKTCQA